MVAKIANIFFSISPIVMIVFFIPHHSTDSISRSILLLVEGSAVLNNITASCVENLWYDLVIAFMENCYVRIHDFW